MSDKEREMGDGKDQVERELTGLRRSLEVHKRNIPRLIAERLLELIDAERQARAEAEREHNALRDLLTDAETEQSMWRARAQEMEGYRDRAMDDVRALRERCAEMERERAEVMDALDRLHNQVRMAVAARQEGQG